jgi:hypothetical protein
LGVREFIKYIFSAGLWLKEFKCYKDIISFVNQFLLESGLKFSRKVKSSYISEIKLKMLGKVIAPNRFILSKENRMFYDYVIKTYPQYKSVLSTKYLQSSL